MSSTRSTLEKRIERAISANPYLSGRSVRLETDAQRVVLRGVVGSYYQKQMAQEALRQIDGIGQIENELEVNWA